MDTDSIEAEQADQFEGSDDGGDAFRPYEEMLVEEEVVPVRPSVAVMRAKISLGIISIDRQEGRQLQGRRKDGGFHGPAKERCPNTTEKRAARAMKVI